MIWGAELSDLLTTSAYNTMRCTCYRNTGNVNGTDWQGTQTQPRLISPLSNAKLQIRSLVCTLRNSNIAITSLVCTLHNSKDNSNYALCYRVKISDSPTINRFQSRFWQSGTILQVRKWWHICEVSRNGFWAHKRLDKTMSVQWNLVITRSLGPWKLPCYIRFLIISG